MVLVDSSVWVLASARGESVEDYAPDDDREIAVCPPIVQEFLRGSRSWAHFQAARTMFRSLMLLDAPTPLERYEEAAKLYIDCRDAGVTVRNNFDCLIAATALAHQTILIHRDSGFDHIARVLPLKAIRV